MVEQENSRTERMRLHITPFNKDLVSRFIPPSLESVATNITFHTIETFPEKAFGFVDLPMMEAEKMKRKFNGSTLKGSKVRISEAKPEKTKQWNSNENAEAIPSEKTTPSKHESKTATKTKYNKDVLAGHRLEEGRIVKRGWQDDPAKKSRKPKKDQSKAEQASLDDKKMRFKTSLPPNAVSIDRDETAKKNKKSKQAGSGKKDVVVKEFSKTTKLVPKPSHSKIVEATRAVSYDDGKGWLDEDGNVVESETKPVSKKRKREELVSSSSSNVNVHTEFQRKLPGTPNAFKPKYSKSHSFSDSGSSTSKSEVSSVVSDDSESDDEDDKDDESSAEESSKDHLIPSGDAADKLQGKAQIINSEQSTVPPIVQKEVHPLEALFKRPLPTSSDSRSKSSKPAPIDTGFSFFNADNPNDDEDGNVDDEYAESNTLIPPQTPHTKADLEWRSTRSSAPTPDTARIDKSFQFTSEGDDDDEDSNTEDDSKADEEGTGATNGTMSQPAVSENAPPRERIFRANENHPVNEESEFRKWFYENRGELNRSWKKRRREERKLKRQRDNRRLSRRVA